MPRVATEAVHLAVGPALKGVEQRPVAGPLSPNKFTMQQYNSRLAIVVEAESDADLVTVLPAYDPSNNSAGSDGVTGWTSFVNTGTFESEANVMEPSVITSLYTPGGPEMASAVALRAQVGAHSSRRSDNIDDSSTSFLVNLRTLMGCTDPLRRGSAHHTSVLSVR